MIWNPGRRHRPERGRRRHRHRGGQRRQRRREFTITANGARVRFDRVNPAPFAIDIGTSENLVLNANGGNDTITATRQPRGPDQPHRRRRRGQRHDPRRQRCRRSPGRRRQRLHRRPAGQRRGPPRGRRRHFPVGSGRRQRHGRRPGRQRHHAASTAARAPRSSKLGQRPRVLFTRNVGNIVMDLDDVENLDLNALGGTDTSPSTTWPAPTSPTSPSTSPARSAAPAATRRTTTSSQRYERRRHHPLTGAAWRQRAVTACAARITITNADASDRLLDQRVSGGNDTINASSRARIHASAGPRRRRRATTSSTGGTGRRSI